MIWCWPCRIHLGPLLEVVRLGLLVLAPVLLQVSPRVVTVHVNIYQHYYIMYTCRLSYTPTPQQIQKNTAMRLEFGRDGSGLLNPGARGAAPPPDQRDLPARYVNTHTLTLPS